MNVCPEGVAYDSYYNETDRVNGQLSVQTGQTSSIG